MKIYDNQILYLINDCSQVARFRGYSDELLLPLEWRPAGGLNLLQQYACGDAVLDKSVSSSLMQRFIKVYGGYMDERRNIKYSEIAKRAFQRMGR